MGEGHGEVSVFTLQKIKRQNESFKPAHHSNKACLKTVWLSHQVFAGCWGLAAPRQPLLQEPGSAEKHSNTNKYAYGIISEACCYLNEELEQDL